MEHLTCMTPDQLIYFLEVTQMELIATTPDAIIVKGEQLFTYVWDYTKERFCLTVGEPA